MVEFKNNIQNNDLKVFFLAVTVSQILFAEFMIYSGKIFVGLLSHITNLLMIMVMICLSSDIKVKYALQSLTLPILLRIINLSVPRFFTESLLQYSLIYGMLFLPIYSIIKNQKMMAQDLGINFKKIYLYLPISIIIGTMTAIIEFKILSPVISSINLIEKIDAANLLLLIIVMLIFIGAVEEIMFRSIIQTRLENLLGIKYSIILTGGLFGIMHTGYGLLNETVFAIIFGIMMSYLFYKSRNVVFMILTHGISNIILFSLIPLKYMGYL